MTSSATTRALAKNTTLQLVGKAVGMIFSIATVALMLRYFGDAGYGEFTTAVTFLSIFAVIVDFGLTLITTQMISEPGADESKILSNLLSLRLLSALAVFAIAPLVAIPFPYSAEIKLAINIGAIAYFFQTVGQMLTGVYQKRLKMLGTVVADLLSRVILLGGMAWVVFHQGSIPDTAIVLVACNVAQTTLLILLANHYVRFRAEIDLAMWKEIIRRSWPIGVSIFFNLLYLRGDVLILSILRTQAEVGQYGSAYKVVDVVSALPVMFMGLVLPILVSAWKGKDPTAFTAMMQKSFNFFSIIAIPIGVGALVLSRPIMVLVGGEQFAHAGSILAILSGALLVVFYNSLFGHAVVAVEKQRVMTLGYAVTALVSIGAYLVFIPSFGAIGAAWVTLLSESLVGLITYLVVRRASHLRLRLAVTAKAAASALIMFLVLNEITFLPVVIQILVGAVVYATVLVALRGVTTQTIKELFQKEQPADV